MLIHEYLRTTNWNRKRTRNGYSALGNTISSFRNLLHVCWEKGLDKLINLSFLLCKCFPAHNLLILRSSVCLQGWLWHDPQPSEHWNLSAFYFKTSGKRPEEDFPGAWTGILRVRSRSVPAINARTREQKYLFSSVNLFLCVFETGKVILNTRSNTGISCQYRWGPGSQENPVSIHTLSYGPFNRINT